MASRTPTWTQWSPTRRADGSWLVDEWSTPAYPAGDPECDAGFKEALATILERATA